jgi:hypothetical protein
MKKTNLVLMALSFVVGFVFFRLSLTEYMDYPTRFLFEIVGGIFLIVALYFYISALLDIQTKKKIRRVYDIITKRFTYGPKVNKNELLRLYQEKDLENYFGTFASFLDSYLASLLENENPKIEYKTTKDIPEGKVAYDEINTILTSIIEEERKVKPYDGVNERERKLLQDIENAAKVNEQTAVKSSLEYLANAIIENQKIYSKENRRNNLISRMGVIITIMGLIATIIVFIIQQHHSLTSNDVKKDMIEVVDSCVVVDANGVSGYHIQSNNVK